MLSEKNCKNKSSNTGETRFIASSLSSLANNLAEGICKNKSKYGHDEKKCETCGIKYKDCNCFFLDTQTLKMI